VFVTGARGFIGRHLCAALEERGAIVRPAAGDNGLARRGTLDDVVALSETLRDVRPDYVIHLAGDAIVESGGPAPAAYATNVVGTVNVLEAAADVGSIRGIVVASSASVYGPRGTGSPYPAESDPLAPEGPYAASKARADSIARSYHESAGLPVAAVRLVNVYGPGDTHLTRLVPATMHALREGRDPVLSGDGRDVRDYLFVTDAVEAILGVTQAASAASIAGQAFNVGTGVGTTSVEVVQTAIAVTGQRSRRPIVAPTVRPPMQYAVDVSRIAALVGWSARISLEQGLRLTWESTTRVATA
jgi:nucleoside-diphosphate-sugar epimerase